MVVYHVCPQEHYDYQTQNGVFEVYHFNIFNKPQFSHLIGIWCAEDIDNAIYGSQNTRDKGCFLLRIDADEEKLDPCNVGERDYFIYRTKYINLCDMENLGWVGGRSNDYFLEVA